MLAPTIVSIGILINAVGTFSYLIATLQGKIRPNKVTYLAWSLAPLVTFFAQVTQHVGVQSWMTLSVAIFPLSIFVGSFVHKDAHWKLIPKDVACGLLSIIGLVLWQITKVGNVAIFFSLLAEAFAALPTIIKAYHYPETESAWPWLASTTSGILTIITITNWDFAHLAFPLLYTAEMSVLFFFTRFRPHGTPV